MQRCRVTIEYDIEDEDAFDVGIEANHWKTGGIDIPTLDDGDGLNTTIKVETILGKVGG